MSFSLLIAKKEGEKTFPYYYRLGWLVEGKNKKFHWPELGRVNTLENAIKAAKTCSLAKQRSTYQTSLSRTQSLRRN